MCMIRGGRGGKQWVSEDREYKGKEEETRRLIPRYILFENATMMNGRSMNLVKFSDLSKLKGKY